MTPKNELRAGSRIGVLTVSEITKDSRGRTTCRCLCDCGTERFVAPSDLLRTDRPRPTGCNCHRRLRKLQKGEAYLNYLIRFYKRNCTVRSRKFAYDLSKEDFKDLVTGDCYYCGETPSRSINISYNGKFNHHGIDRIDPHQGYTTSNCVTCCKFCNFAKNDLTTKQFAEHVVRLYRGLLTNGLIVEKEEIDAIN